MNLNHCPSKILQKPQLYIPNTVNPCEPISIQPSQSVEVNYQTKSKTNMDSHFLVICISLLLLLLAVVGFVGYWLMVKVTEHHNTNDKQNKRRERFLTMFLCGYGILTAIVILVLFYLIIRN